MTENWVLTDIVYCELNGALGLDCGHRSHVLSVPGSTCGR